jgi:hypothetical protein
LFESIVMDEMDSTLMMANSGGDIGMAQIKLTVPVKGSGANIPISISYANRTELIDEEEVRGNIGVILNLDTLIAKAWETYRDGTESSDVTDDLFFCCPTGHNLLDSVAPSA